MALSIHFAFSLFFCLLLSPNLPLFFFPFWKIISLMVEKNARQRHAHSIRADQTHSSVIIVKHVNPWRAARITVSTGGGSKERENKNKGYSFFTSRFFKYKVHLFFQSHFGNSELLQVLPSNKYCQLPGSFSSPRLYIIAITVWWCRWQMEQPDKPVRLFLPCVSGFMNK